MFQQLLNAITGRTSEAFRAEPERILRLDLARVEAVTQRDAKPRPKPKSYPRSVCTSLKDLCEL